MLIFVHIHDFIDLLWEKRASGEIATTLAMTRLRVMVELLVSVKELLDTFVHMGLMSYVLLLSRGAKALIYTLPYPGA